MKKIILSLILSIFLLTLVNAASYNYTTNWFYNSNPVSSVRAINFICSDSGCYNLGTRLSDYTSSTNSITVSYPIPSPTYGYATYWFSSCHVYQEMAWKPCSPTSCSNYASSVNVDFTKKGNCNATIRNFNAPSSIDKNNQITITADIDSAFSEAPLAPWAEPNDADIVRDFLSAQTNIILEIKNSSNSIIHTETIQEYILRDNSEHVSFSWIPTQAGNYNITLKTTVVDCKCSSNIIKKVSKILIVNEIPTPECTQDSDCGETELVNQYCSSDNLMGNYSVPSCLFGQCDIDYSQDLIQICAYGCSQGACLPPTECTQDSDCGSSELINNYCSGNNLMNNYSDPSCLFGECEINFIQSLNQTCDYGCSQGECLPEHNITCYANSDCGQSGCAGGANYCLFNDVYQDFIFFTCHNPGTYESYCSNTTSPFLLEECSYSCSNGWCIPKPDECSINSDCGQSSLINNYCSGNNLMNNYSDPSCLFGECEINFIQSLNQTCAYGCSNGECLPPTPECSINSDCGIITSSLICLGNNLTNATWTPLCINNSCQSSASYIFIKKCIYGCSNGKCDSCDSDDEDNGYKQTEDEETICGNDICEDWLGENENNCEEDCFKTNTFFYNDSVVNLGGKKASVNSGNNLILIILGLLILLLLIFIGIFKSRK